MIEVKFYYFNYDTNINKKIKYSQHNLILMFFL